jgi:hypothetical protein
MPRERGCAETSSSEKSIVWILAIESTGMQPRLNIQPCGEEYKSREISVDKDVAESTGQASKVSLISKTIT